MLVQGCWQLRQLQGPLPGSQKHMSGSRRLMMSEWGESNNSTTIITHHSIDLSKAGACSRAGGMPRAAKSSTAGYGHRQNKKLEKPGNSM